MCLRAVSVSTPSLFWSFVPSHVTASHLPRLLYSIAPSSLTVAHLPCLQYWIVPSVCPRPHLPFSIPHPTLLPHSGLGQTALSFFFIRSCPLELGEIKEGQVCYK